MKKTSLIKATKIMIVSLILFFLIKTLINSWDQVSMYSFKINYTLLILAIITICISYISAAIGWIYTIKKLKQDLSIKKGLSIFFKAQISRYIPGTIWSYIGRVYLSKKENIPKTITSISLVLEAIFLLSTSAIISFLALFSYLKSNEISNYPLYFIIAAIPLILLHPTILNFLINKLLKLLKKQETNIKIRYLDLLKIFSIYILRGILLGMGFVIFTNSIYPINIANWPLLFGASLLSWVIGYLFVIAPGGMGVKEAVIAFLLKPIMPIGISIIIALGSRILLILGEITAFGLIKVYNTYSEKKTL
jgi:hypothetical protein